MKISNHFYAFLKVIIGCLILSGAQGVLAQDEALEQIKYSIQEVEGHVYFLASDELQGRRTGEAGNHIAARYIAEQFRRYGLSQVEGAEDEWFQSVALRSTTPPKNGAVNWGDNEFTNGKNLIQLAGGELDGEFKAVFAGFGLVNDERDDYKGLDVKGKVVFTISGLPNPKASTQEIFQSMREKRELAAEKGAVALVEFYRLGIPWPFFMRYFSGSRVELIGAEDETSGKTFPYLMIQEGESGIAESLKKKSSKVKVAAEGINYAPVQSRNVIGMVEGTDPELKDEYLIVTAHFDHVGTGKNGGGAYTAEDSIFNGARDNAIGTTALLGTAKHIAKYPLKRSVIFLAVTGEEMGLLGSSYYSDNPLIPLEKTIFNINTDGAGYNVDDKVTVIGIERAGTEEEFKKAAEYFGLTAIADPAPEQGLFDRSDNVNFAKKGIPAITYSLGFTAFDDEIMKYYHQVSDNPDNVNYEYVHKYCQSFIAATILIGSKEELPMWKEGDKYYDAAVELYKLR